jgi:hypothetical protein
MLIQKKRVKTREGGLRHIAGGSIQSPSVVSSLVKDREIHMD